MKPICASSLRSKGSKDVVDTWYIPLMTDQVMQNLEREVQAIKDRNARVEAEKAWETSNFRVVSLAIITYGIAAIFLFVLGNEHPWRNALIPAIGFVLSVQSLPFLKSFWIRRNIKL